jgi:hypothetical protein
MEISRFPCKRLLRVPGSTTTRGRHASCDIDTGRVAFCGTENIGTPNLSYAAQYLARALPCERFTPTLTGSRASLGAGVVRYSFTVTDFHRLLLPVSRRTRPQHQEPPSRMQRGSGFLAKVSIFEPMRQIWFVGRRFQHYATLRQGIDPIGDRECLLDQLLHQQHGGSGLA